MQSIYNYSMLNILINLKNTNNRYIDKYKIICNLAFKWYLFNKMILLILICNAYIHIPAFF